MTLEILTFTLGPLGNNSYLLADPLSQAAVLIDPAFGAGEAIVPTLAQRGWALNAIWITHAHFDHIAGVSEILARVATSPQIALHPLDLPLWQNKGGASLFGFPLGELPTPDLELSHGQTLLLGDVAIQVRHAPGHSPGHVAFYIPSAQTMLCGDVIFYHSIGRTDLPGGSLAQLEKSIRETVYTLPPRTRLLNGHGPETTVGEESAHNPFVQL